MKKARKILYGKLFTERHFNDGKWHIFNKDTYDSEKDIYVSLCKRIKICNKTKQRREKVKKDNEYIKGNDCKSCFNKAGLVKDIKIIKKSLHINNLPIKGVK